MTNISMQGEIWADFYSVRRQSFAGRYPTEWVVRTLAGGNYPSLTLDKSLYRGRRILDMGCGDGRNIPLLIDLYFDVYACEISKDIVAELELTATRAGISVQFDVGSNAALPYEDSYFDYMLCCASCYYLGPNTKWLEVIAELGRVIKPGGLLIANFPDFNNFVLSDATRNEDGTFLITSDPYGLRNGMRFIAAENASELQVILGPEFRVLSVGHQDDDFYGIRVSCYLVVAERIENS